ncbi:MCP four helix bundle domain-containing protein [Hymenobacter latericus]|uniref:MCP four helix bundle domain-containing protein n=1 Tax=Hymenobacter sp. YIM 151858-1 TaxID=2987688 RepID=UPI0022269756|nr:MCP four helix bundle domain-containing protein [Hymenobacter sp. YIM 151858-1]UYZ57700.1 MCP four helix bundle domain-containing protein [Hymenobacter sp. YIM 151858-1]
MSPLHRIHHKAKPAFLFLVVLLVVLGSSIVEKRLMHNATTSAASLYNDRLLPATGLFQLNDLMYAKQQLLASYLGHPTAEQQRYATMQLAGRNVQIDSLVSRYEQTYLVVEENRVLQEFKRNLHRYNAHEKHLLAAANSPSAADVQQLAREFDTIHTELTKLSQIQLQVGQELSKSSATTESNATLLSNLQIAILIVFALAIQQVLLLDRHPLVPRDLKNFRLN